MSTLKILIYLLRKRIVVHSLYAVVRDALLHELQYSAFITEELKYNTSFKGLIQFVLKHLHAGQHSVDN